ncbi:MAG: efflux RND transporter periplasmic adaptor subunit [Nitrospiraceae bacterium]
MIAGSALVLAVAVGGCGAKDESAPARETHTSAVSTPSAAAPKSVAVVEVVSRAVPVRVEVTGQVATVYQATLSSRIQGTIERLLVREGSVVKKGQTLIELDRRDAEADVARTTAEVENAAAHLRRMEGLLGEQAVSKQEMENATRAFKVADAARKTAVAQQSYTLVKAPFDGVITEKKVEAGEMASPGQALLKMEDPRQLRLEATVAESDLSRVSRGDAIPVLIDAVGPQPLAGTVSQILPAGDPQTHTFMVKVDLPASQTIKTGMFGRFVLERGTAQTLLVPVSAVVTRGELTSVFTVGVDAVSRLRWVKVGRRLGDELEVLSGVTVGERVLVDAAQGVDGLAVRVAG